MGKAYNVANLLPDEALALVYKALVKDPRQRHLAVIEFHSMRTDTEHPDDEPDFHRPMLKIDALVPIVDGADADQARAMMARARLELPGQGTLDEAQQAGQ
jgi:hypothetical protein